MKILGLILELNPFHNGHKYFIEKAKESTKADLVIAIVSSSFTMRGEVSVIDKFKKCDLCLENGIDIIIENPLAYTLASSDNYAYNAISELNAFHIDYLAFGSETDSLDTLYKYLNIQSSNSYEEKVKYYLDKGMSLSASSSKAMLDLGLSKDEVIDYSKPNNTLALSYLKAIKEINDKIIPVSIKRIGDNYYDKTSQSDSYTSASALRSKLDANEDINKFIPNYEYQFLKEKEINEKLFMLYKYAFISLKDDVKNVYLVSEGIENRLASYMHLANYDDYINNIQTKRYLVNRVKRIIISILFNLRAQKYIPYKRVLGLDDKGMKYLKSIIKKENFKCILNTNDALNEDLNQKEILKLELEATKIYELITNKNIFKEEYKLRIKHDN